MLNRRLSRPQSIALAAVLIGCLALGTLAADSADARKGNARPHIVQISYAETDDGSSRRYDLSGFARRADSFRFATRFKGKRVGTGTRYSPSITDTDIKGKQAKHPWRIVRKGGGRKVLRAVRRSLQRNGKAIVRARAKNGSGVEKVRVRIKLSSSSCSQDPPFYPVSCEIRP